MENPFSKYRKGESVKSVETLFRVMEDGAMRVASIEDFRGEKGDSIRGDDGRGIRRLFLKARNLIISYTDGVQEDIGVIVGKDGKDGVSIIDTVQNANGELIVYYSNGIQKNCGLIRGKDGNDGKPKDGKDGRGIKSCQINEDGEFCIYYTDGTEENHGKIRQDRQNNIVSGMSSFGVGVRNNGTLVGMGFTNINFTGSGIGSITKNGREVTVDVSGGGGGGTPAGSTGQVQFNNAGAFAADSNFTWDNTNKRLGIGGVTPTARLQVRGSGATSSTFGLIVENSSAAAPLSIRDDGNLYLGASASGAIISATDGTDSVVVTGNCGLRYRSALTLQNAGSDHFFRNYQGSRSATSGASRLMYFNGSFAPTSGTGTYEGMLIDGTINQTGGASGITRGVYINPTLTAAADYRAFDTSASTGHAYYSSGAAPSRLAGALTIENNLASNNSFNASTTTAADGRSISYRFLRTSSDFLASVTAAWRGGTISTRINLEFYVGGDSVTPPMAIRPSLNGNAVAVGSNIQYAWSSTTNSSTGAIDTALARNAAGVVEINNGTAGTYVDLRVRSAFFTRTATAASASSAGETIIGVTSTAAARTITLSTADCVSGRIMYIKDESGGAGTNNITIDTQGSELIDGAASIVITANYGVAKLYSNGSNWFTL